MIYEAAHWIALAPVAALARRRPKGVTYVLVALAFGTAFVHESWAQLNGGSWEGVAYWMLAQFALLILAFGGPAVALAYAVASWGLWMAGPEVLATFGAIVVLLLAKNHRLAWSMFAYCGLGTLAYLAMAAEWQGVFMPWWWAYQGARLAAFGLFAHAAWRSGA